MKISGGFKRLSDAQDSIFAQFVADDLHADGKIAVKAGVDRNTRQTEITHRDIETPMIARQIGRIGERHVHARECRREIGVNIIKCLAYIF